MIMSLDILGNSASLIDNFYVGYKEIYEDTKKMIQYGYIQHSAFTFIYGILKFIWRMFIGFITVIIRMFSYILNILSKLTASQKYIIKRNLVQSMNVKSTVESLGLAMSYLKEILYYAIVDLYEIPKRYSYLFILGFAHAIYSLVLKLIITMFDICKMVGIGLYVDFAF